MSKIDELFEKKLSEHVITPSQAAWENIEAGLSKKNKPVIWLRWAAVFLLGGLFLGALWLKTQTNELPLAEKESPVIPKQEPQVPEVKTSKPALASQQSSPRKTVSKKKNATEAKKQSETLVEEKSVEQKSLDVATNESIVPVIVEKTVGVEKSKPIVLVYTLDAVTTSEHENTTAIASEEKREGLKKVVQFALDIKNGESPLGIREMKDELFARDLKSKSTKKQH